MPAMEVGQGYSSEQNTAKDMCLEGSFERVVEPFEKPPERLQRLYTSFVSNSLDEAVEEACRNFPGDHDCDEDLTGNGLRTTRQRLQLFYERYFYPSTSSKPVSVATFRVYVRSALERAQLTEFVENDFCTGDPSDTPDVESFTDRCGGSYVEAKVYGGYVFFAINLDEIGSQSRRELIESMQLNGVGQFQNMVGRLEGLESTDFEFHLFTGALNGLPVPYDDLYIDPSEDRIEDDSIARYLTELEEGNSSAGWPGYRGLAEQGHIDRRFSGKLVDYALQRYDDRFVAYCSGNPDIVDGVGCYADFRGHVSSWYRYYYDRLGEASYYLDHAGDYCWNTELQSRWQDFLDHLWACHGDAGADVEQSEDNCEQARRNGPSANICDVCRLPGYCSFQAIAADEPAVKPVRNENCTPADPWSKTYYDGESQDLANHPVADEICTLHGLGGRFEGTGEEVKVSQNSNQTTWRIDVNSDRTEPSEKVHGRVACVEKGNFISSDTSSWMTEQDFEVKKPNNQIEGLGVNDMRAAVIQGVSGKMEGGAEFADVSFNANIQPAEWQLTTDSNQGEMHAFASVFGLTLPHAVNYSIAAREVNNHDSTWYGRKVENLTPADESFCYLSHIDGDFDGAGERIEVRRNTDINYWQIEVNGGCDKGFLDFGIFPDFNPCEDTDNIKKLRAKVYCYRYDQQ